MINNQEMIRNYLPGVPYCYTSGSPYSEDQAPEISANAWPSDALSGRNATAETPWS
jgi:hypothetical protein